LRAFFLEGLTSKEVARQFGYSHGAFRGLCLDLRPRNRSDGGVSRWRHPSTEQQKLNRGRHAPGLAPIPGGVEPWPPRGIGHIMVKIEQQLMGT
jgi:hypothetical protein